MGRIDDLANRYVDEWAPLDPLSATFVGIAGYDHDLGDLTPGGYAALADLDRRTLDELRDIEPDTESERVAREAMAERLSVSLARYDAGDVVGQLNVIESGLHSVRSAFDLMPIEGEAAAGNVASRLAQLPGVLEQIKESVTYAAERGRLASTAQIVEVAKQCDMWTDPAGDNFYPELARRVIAANDRSGPAASAAAHDPDRSADLPDGLRADLERDAAEAAAATAAFGQWLRTELAPRGAAKDAVGRERYQLASQYFLGDTVDLDETYAWGFEELARLEAEMRVVAGKVVPDGGIDEAVAELDRDPSRTIPGKEAFRDWMQRLSDQAVAELAGTHFDIPEQVRLLECRIAPTSDGSIYYTGPSEDFTRPGRMWWSVPQGITEFSTWREVTTVYHEGVPGHHLQVAQTAVRAELLNRYQRLLCWVSGHGEGWALYAENLMDELGYLEDPGDRLGMLDGSAFRAARVIVDIGLHLELEIPRDNPFGFHPGERWTPELGWEFLRAHCRIPDENLRFELNRYLGWPGQAPSYKVGERTWLQARADAKARKGADFDLKAFHRYALDLGSLGLGPLKGALARF